MLGTGKHWQQTIKGITKANIGEELQTLGSNYKYWLTLWSSGETLGSNYKHWLNIVGQRGNFGNQLQSLAKHCGTKTNVGEELQTLGGSYKRWGAGKIWWGWQAYYRAKFGN